MTPDHVAAARVVATARATGSPPRDASPVVAALILTAAQGRVSDDTLIALIGQAVEQAVPRHELPTLAGLSKQTLLDRLRRLNLMGCYQACPDRVTAHRASLRDKASGSAVQGKGLTEAAKALGVPRAYLRRVLLENGGVRVLVRLLRNDTDNGRVLPRGDQDFLRMVTRQDYRTALDPDHHRETA